MVPAVDDYLKKVGVAARGHGAEEVTALDLAYLQEGRFRELDIGAAAIDSRRGPSA
jgi:hypothetical protein